MPTSLCLIVWLLVFLFDSAPAVASHFRGGAITYQHLGEGRYEVLIKSYWDNVEIGSVVPRYQGSPNLETAVQTVSQNLLEDGSTVEHVQRQTIKWSQPGIYEISWKSCCRAVGANFDKESIGLFAVVNYSVASPSSSPVFQDVPLSSFQPGQWGVIDLGAEDPEGHAQTYALAIPYGLPDSVYQRMQGSGFQLSSTGLLTWESPLEGKWLVNVKVSELIDGVYTEAYVLRDFILEVKPCILPSPAYSVLSEPCVGSSNGSVALRATGGTGPFRFSLDGGLTFQDGSEFAELSAGEYEGMVVDAQGCVSDQVHITLAEAPLPSVTLTLPARVCADASPVALTGGYPAGGIYEGMGVRDGLFYPDVAGIGVHVLNYLYTDSNGCSNIASDSITVMEKLIANAGRDTTVYYGYGPQSCVVLTASASGGVDPYTYRWSTGETTPSIQVCPTDTSVFELWVTDSMGCSATDQVTVAVLDVRTDTTGTTNGNKGDVVVMCVDGKPMEVKEKHVEKELSRGSQLGPCDTTTAAASTQVMLKAEASHKALSATLPPSAESGITVFPNPISSGVPLRVHTTKAQTLKVELLDVTGKLLRTLYEGNLSAGQELQLEHGLEVTPSKVYILQITTVSTRNHYKLLML